MLDFITEVKRLWAEYGAWAIIAVLSFVEYKFKPLRKIYKSLDLIAQNAENHKKIVEKIDKVYAELTEQISALRGFVVHELSYNGQSSTKDAVARTEQLVSRIAAQTHVGMELHPYGIFMCDFSGANFYVNRTYAHLIGVTKEELLGTGWGNFLKDENYLEEYRAAFAHKRDFTSIATVGVLDGSEITIKVVATVLQGIDGYMGYVIPIQNDNNIYTSTQTKQETSKRASGKPRQPDKSKL